MMHEDDSKLIDALGGTVEVARICDVSSQAVSKWRVSGIPAARRMYLRVLRPDVFADAEESSRKTVQHPRSKPCPLPASGPGASTGYPTEGQVPQDEPAATAATPQAGATRTVAGECQGVV